MTAPDWLIWLTLITSLLAAFSVSAFVSVRSITRGESLGRQWVKQILFGTLAALAVWAAYFIIGNVLASILT